MRGGQAVRHSPLHPSKKGSRPPSKASNSLEPYTDGISIVEIGINPFLHGPENESHSIVKRIAPVFLYRTH